MKENPISRPVLPSLMNPSEKGSRTTELPNSSSRRHFIKSSGATAATLIAFAGGTRSAHAQAVSYNVSGFPSGELTYMLFEEMSYFSEHYYARVRTTAYPLSALDPNQVSIHIYFSAWKSGNSATAEYRGHIQGEISGGNFISDHQVDENWWTLGQGTTNAELESETYEVRARVDKTDWVTTTDDAQLDLKIIIEGRKWLSNSTTPGWDNNSLNAKIEEDNACSLTVERV